MAKEFPAAREHFDETTTLELFSRLIFAVRYQKLSPRLNLYRFVAVSIFLTQLFFVLIMALFYGYK